MRIIIIGIDGADLNILNKVDAPNIKALPTKNAMRSTIPPFSPIAWNTLFTGVGPQQHGIYGFVQPKANSYDYEIVSSKTRKVKALWNMFKGVYLNIPFAYPLEHIDGIITAGLGSPNDGYGEGKHDIQSRKFRLHAFQVLRQEIRQAKRLFKKKEFEVFATVFRLTDVLQHYYWGDWQTIGKAYRKIDEFVGFVMQNKQKDDVVMVVSDHGFCGATQCFCVNQWLAEKGYLHLPVAKSSKVADFVKRTPFRSFALSLLRRPFFNKFIKRVPLAGFNVLDNIDERTIAYYVPGSCTSITLNLKDRQPNGRVEIANYNKVALKLKNDLSSCPCIKDVYLARDLYETNVKDLMYDIIFSLEEGWTFRSHDEDEQVYKELDTGVNATHTLWGLFASTQEAIKDIHKVAPYVIKKLGKYNDDKVVLYQLKNLGYL